MDRAAYDHERWHRQKRERRAEDPIHHLTETELAYLAGLTDADGSIFVTHGNRLRTYYPCVCWAMTHRPTIDWVASILGGTKVMLHNGTNLRRQTAGWGVATGLREQWRTTLTGYRAQALCERMVPYMHTKADQARIVIAFPTDERGARTLSDEVRQQRVELGRQLSELNRWGRP